MKTPFNFDTPSYFDLPPEDKSEAELEHLVLSEANGDKIDLKAMKKYSEREIHSMARKLLLKGFLRGTIFDSAKCSWSRTTLKGRMYLDVKKVLE